MWRFFLFHKIFFVLKIMWNINNVFSSSVKLTSDRLALLATCISAGYRHRTIPALRKPSWKSSSRVNPCMERTCLQYYIWAGGQTQCQAGEHVFAECLQQVVLSWIPISVVTVGWWQWWRSITSKKLEDHPFCCRINTGGGSVELTDRSTDRQTLKVSNSYSNHPSSWGFHIWTE